MSWRPIEIIFLLGALSACKSGENDVSEGLKSPDRHVRSRAVLALGDSKDHAGSVRELEAVLRQDADRGVRIDATVALGQLGGPDATAVLVEMAASTDEAIFRTAALEAIEKGHDPSAIPGVINLFRLNRGEDDTSIQFEARHALVKFGALGMPQLLQALNDSSAKVRKAVVEVLGEMGNPEVVDQIAGLQTDPDPAVRRAVERALATLKDKPAPATR